MIALELELPTAEAVARAVVASARKLGEDPERIYEEPLRCRFIAGHALKIIYPGASFTAIGRMVNVVGQNPAAHFANIKRLVWWREEADEAIEAALEALEAL